MKKAICHYSLNRVFKSQNWTLEQLVGYVRDQGVEGIDFHVRFLPAPEQAAEAILRAMKGSGLTISGLSLSTDFNQADPGAFRRQIDTAARWLEVAQAVQAPVSRVFGGWIADRTDPRVLATGRERVLLALRELTPVAARHGVVLALENHGGLPCTGEEQVEMIQQIGSPFLRATVDVGNYMAGGQAGHVGAALAAPYCAYVHFKDFRRLPDGSLESTVIGEGEVDHRACLAALRKSGFDGFVALEYEANEDELRGVPKSIAHMRRVMAGF